MPSSSVVRSAVRPFSSSGQIESSDFTVTRGVAGSSGTRPVVVSRCSSTTESETIVNRRFFSFFRFFFVVPNKNLHIPRKKTIFKETSSREPKTTFFRRNSMSRDFNRTNRRRRRRLSSDPTDRRIYRRSVTASLAWSLVSPSSQWRHRQQRQEKKKKKTTTLKKTSSQLLVSVARTNQHRALN